MAQTAAMENYNTQKLNQTDKTKKKGISGSTLKLIAIFSMLIDHIFAAVITRINIDRGLLQIVAQDAETQSRWLIENPLYSINMLMRLTIGRLAFPIFCFLLVEGLQKTRSVTKYAFRLGIFAVLSEIPFDLAFAGNAFYVEYQNVFLTLFLGFLVIAAFSWIEKQISSREKKSIAVEIGKVLLMVVILVVGMETAKLLKTDYDAFGVLLIAVLYLCRRKKLWQAIGGSLVLTVGGLLIMGSLSELFAIFAFLPIAFYNGERGLKLKYVFYLFYPVHLLLLYFISFCMGLGNISTI